LDVLGDDLLFGFQSLDVLEDDLLLLHEFYYMFPMTIVRVCSARIAEFTPERALVRKFPHEPPIKKRPICYIVERIVP